MAVGWVLNGPSASIIPSGVPGFGAVRRSEVFNNSHLYHCGLSQSSGPHLKSAN